MSTTQLKNEQKHKVKFICKLPTIGCIEKFEWDSGKNKKKNSDADFTIIIQNPELFKTEFPDCNKDWVMGTELTVSLKTERGNFTLANGGTTLKSGLFQLMELNREEKKAFQECNVEITNIKNELGRDKCWEDIGQHEKKPIKDTLIGLLYRLFQVPTHIDTLYTYMNGRQSDLKYVGENLSLKKKFTPPPYDLLIVDIISTNTLRVGDFTLRVKSESKSVKSSWKINYEVFIEK